MGLRTVLVTPVWSLQRPGQRALVMCDIALVQNEDDCGFYEVRITLNGEPLYAACAIHTRRSSQTPMVRSPICFAQARGAGDDGSSVYDS